MIVTINTERGQVLVEEAEGRSTHDLSSPEAFNAISKAWLRCGWDNKYVYSFTWMGRPIIQLPEDIIRIQEIVYTVRPDVIVETGVAHGGSLILYASLFKAMGRGRVIGVDIDIRPHNRRAIEEHALASYITLVEGDSTEPGVVADVKSRINPGEATLVLLDSCHSKEHVTAELEAYSELVTVGSYIVAMDGIMGELAGAPRSCEDWSWNNPSSAALEFVNRAPNFVIEQPPFAFNEGTVEHLVTYSPGGFIRRVK